MSLPNLHKICKFINLGKDIVCATRNSGIHVSSTALFDTSMSAEDILELKKVPRVGVFTH